MKKLSVLLTAFAVMVSCSEWDNDIYKPQPVPPELAPAVDSKGQLYNMGFDSWSSSGDCYADNASKEQKRVWASASSATKSFCGPICSQESEFVAIQGPGESAVKLETKYIDSEILFFKITKLASGNMFTGQMGDIEYFNQNAKLKWGIPFNRRPVALEGYACYRPVAIDVADDQHKNLIGVNDSAHVFVLLTDWDEQFIVDPAANSFVDIDNDPHIIGYGKKGYRNYMQDYEKFTINIEYRSSRTPRYVVIVASSSAYGDYFTGGNGSVFYLDEFKFLY